MDLSLSLPFSFPSDLLSPDNDSIVALETATVFAYTAP